MQVLQAHKGRSLPFCQWAAAGYLGAIKEQKTICGTLFGGTVFLGLFHGGDAAQVPGIEDDRRSRAIESVQGLFQGFLARFGATDCFTLTGCDWSDEESVKRYIEEVYQQKCLKFLEYVLAYCLDQQESPSRPSSAPVISS